MPRSTGTVRRALRKHTLVAAIALACASPLAAADSLDELRALVSANDVAPAWDMAQRMEPENAGDPDFDFFYGLAAKAAGQKNQAVFALERVLLAQPDNPRAKLELADIYFQFGNKGEARTLFDEVLATAPPEQVQQRIRTYLGAIEASEKRSGVQVKPYVGVAAGFDSNISSATDDADQGDIIPSLILSAQSLAADAAFLEARGGVDIVAPVNQRTIRFLSLGAQRRDNEDIFSGGNFDNTQLTVSGGWLLRRGTSTWRIPVGLSALWAESESATPVNDDRFQFTLGTEYTRPLSARTAFSLFGRVGETHYPSEENRNGYLALVGAGYNWSAPSAPLSVMSTLHMATEPTREAYLQPAGVTKNPNGRDYAAVRVNVRWSLSAAHSVSTSLGAQMSSYHERPVVGNFDREDLLVDAAIGWQWQASKQLAVNLDVSAMNNDSDGNTLYDFERQQGKLGATWRF